MARPSKKPVGVRAHFVRIHPHFYRKCKILAAFFDRDVQNVVHEAVMDLTEKKYAKVLKEAPCVDVKGIIRAPINRETSDES